MRKRCPTPGPTAVRAPLTFPPGRSLPFLLSGPGPLQRRSGAACPPRPRVQNRAPRADLSPRAVLFTDATLLSLCPLPKAVHRS